MREIRYRPHNLRETLVELKDSSELAVDLAYSAVLFDDEALAEEVLELEARADYLQYHARIAMMLAAKNTDDAEALVGVFQVVDGAVATTSAAADIAAIPGRALGIPEAVRALPEAHERFVRAVVAEGAPLAGRPLGDLDLELEEGVRVIAVRRGEEWRFAPGGDDELRAGDVAFARGPDAGVAAFSEAATGADYEPPAVGETSDTVVAAVETVVELKNVSELAVGLAYSAALFDSDALAEEVRELEGRADRLREELERLVVEAGADAGGAGSGGLRGLFHIAVAAEVICDAALGIAEVVFREVELHPVFGQAITESNEVITAVDVDGELADGTVGDVEAAAETGTTVLALHRAGGWRYDPAAGTELAAGDRLLVKGPRRGVDRLGDLAGRP